MLYDGSPFRPHDAALYEVIETERLTHFGGSPKFFEMSAKTGLAPKRDYDLSSLRVVLSTGSPLPHESFDYLYDAVKSDVCVSSISGGTEIMTCFMTGNPTGAVWQGELQAKALGMAVDVFDPDGRSLAAGEKGELVCVKPFPSTPIGFWNDPTGARYHDAYFARYANVWHHGDYAQWTAHGGMIIHGRSDATLKPGGVRIGTAEIYRPVEQIAEVQDSLVIGQPWQGDVRVVLFVCLNDGLTLDDALVARIKAHIRSAASPRHVPAKIVQVPVIPKTRTGKLAELAVLKTVMGDAVDNRNALVEPAALDAYVDLPELRD